VSHFQIVLLALFVATSGTAYGLLRENGEDTSRYSIPQVEHVEVSRSISDRESLAEAQFQSVALPARAASVAQAEATRAHTIPIVPFYSQFDDISDSSWQKIGCGIASLAMLINYYEPDRVTVDNLLAEGIASGAYLKGAGWIHKGLADLAKEHGFAGGNTDLSSASMDTAFRSLSEALEEGPVIASVYYTFDPLSPIPHLVVINGIDGDGVHYNDPSEDAGGGTISLDKFKKAWKKRYIEIRSAS
jgi:predicted double-glycine peptidase